MKGQVSSAMIPPSSYSYLHSCLTLSLLVMSTSLRCGCYFTLPSGREAVLPLLSVSAQVHIADGKPETYPSSRR